MFVIVFFVLSTGFALADTLLIESVERNSSIARPERGLSMAVVERQYGKATKQHTAIGEPRITKWDYKGITVYFENDHVIHSVVNRKN